MSGTNNKLQNALTVLNDYRNSHYADASGTESHILANAINDALPILTTLAEFATAESCGYAEKRSGSS